MYKKTYDRENKLINIRYENKSIPISEENSDYKAFLQAVEDGAEIIDVPYTDDEILEFKKKDALLSVNASIDAQIALGFDYKGKMFRLSRDDQSNYGDALEKSKNGLFAEYGITEFDFTLVNGEYETVPVAEIKALTDAAFLFKATILKNGKDKKKAIKACITLAELDEILNG